MLLATHLGGKHIYAAVNQHAAIEEAVFSFDPSRGCILRISHSWNEN
jgi:hypothetical protein